MPAQSCTRDAFMSKDPASRQNINVAAFAHFPQTNISKVRKFFFRRGKAAHPLVCEEQRAPDTGWNICTASRRTHRRSSRFLRTRKTSDETLLSPATTAPEGNQWRVDVVWFSRVHLTGGDPTLPTDFEEKNRNWEVVMSFRSEEGEVETGLKKKKYIYKKEIPWQSLCLVRLESEWCKQQKESLEVHSFPLDQLESLVQRQVLASHLRTLPTVFEGAPAAIDWSHALCGGRLVLFPLRRRTLGFMLCNLSSVELAHVGEWNCLRSYSKGLILCLCLKHCSFSAFAATLFLFLPL